MEDNNSLKFERLNPTKLFFKCSVPAMLSMLFSGIYSIADGIFVGHFIGADALAAVNLAMPLIMISFALSDMVAVGSSVQIAMLLGEKDNDEANRTFSVCVKVIVAISVAVGVFFFFVTKPILVLMGAEGQALQLSLEYIRVFAVFAPVTIIYFALDNYLRICGKQNYSMIMNIATAVLNILLDFLLIVVWEQGIWAAAFASCISIAVGTLTALVPFFRKSVELRFVRGTIPKHSFFKLVANGASEFFANIAGSVFMFILNIVLLAIGGATAVAAMSVVMYVESVMGMVLFGMCDSMQPPISYCYGAGLQKRVFALEKRVLVAAAAFSIAAFLFLRFSGEWVVPLFVKAEDTELMELSIHAMSLYAFSYLVNWVDGCLSMYLTALGQAARSFILSMLGTLGFPLLGLAVLVPTLGIDGVCLMPLMAGILSGAVAVVLAVTIKHPEK